jgi:hypothetical protein
MHLRRSAQFEKNSCFLSRQASVDPLTVSPPSNLGVKADNRRSNWFALKKDAGGGEEDLELEEEEELEEEWEEEEELEEGEEISESNDTSTLS